MKCKDNPALRGEPVLKKAFVAFLVIFLLSWLLADEIWVFVDALNMRSCPSLRCRVVKVLSYGTVLQEMERAVYTDSYDWIEVMGGWVALQFVDYIPMEVVGDLPLDFDLNYSDLPLPPYYVPSDLVEIPEEFTTKKGLKLREKAVQALVQMLKAARKAGYNIKVASAFRSWGYQRKIYVYAIERYGPDQEEVAKPGRSEHQLGLAVDLVRADMRCALQKCFKDTPEYRWLINNSWKYGFIQPYIKYNILYVEEPWHFRYVGKEAAKEYMSNFELP